MPQQVKRIGIRDKRFSIPFAGDTCTLDVVIIGVAYISRMYYKEAYDPTKTTSPTCWSTNTDTPAVDVPEHQRQAVRCLDCVHNIKGSGYGRSRACRFAQKIALTLVDDLHTIYQLQLPPTSIFGDIVKEDMPFRAYARYLDALDTPLVTLVTKLFFDTNSGIPKLFFRPIRPLEEEELETVKVMMEHPDTLQAITANVIPIADVVESPFSEVGGFKLDS
tara:strand:- start:484 stop:1143 length:660 start_codon:yes stop_codon:yes gene_type:complete